jgi:hypothetical protein
LSLSFLVSPSLFSYPVAYISFSPIHLCPLIHRQDSVKSSPRAALWQSVYQYILYAKRDNGRNHRCVIAHCPALIAYVEKNRGLHIDSTSLLCLSQFP